MVLKLSVSPTQHLKLSRIIIRLGKRRERVSNLRAFNPYVSRILLTNERSAWFPAVLVPPTLNKFQTCPCTIRSKATHHGLNGQESTA